MPRPQYGSVGVAGKAMGDFGGLRRTAGSLTGTLGSLLCLGHPALELLGTVLAVGVE
ncbi:hypothetical protein [Streptomyces sp. A1-5]|uniref:hypothetical protein n=1 Tax=Streptomyces sp. A1-5 TaxID=2738410 RepID=UPI001F2A7F21|nr:hypothetical protein [Streptomyces sp. A1-5]UJB46208.1 hypothetical protein HRD51_40625 [Streptomyces sp. A1-5]